MIGAGCRVPPAVFVRSAVGIEDVALHPQAVSWVGEYVMIYRRSTVVASLEGSQSLARNLGGSTWFNEMLRE